MWKVLSWLAFPLAALPSHPISVPVLLHVDTLPGIRKQPPCLTMLPKENSWVHSCHSPPHHHHHLAFGDRKAEKAWNSGEPRMWHSPRVWGIINPTCQAHFNRLQEPHPQLHPGSKFKKIICLFAPPHTHTLQVPAAQISCSHLGRYKFTCPLPGTYIPGAGGRELSGLSAGTGLACV